MRPKPKSTNPEVRQSEPVTLSGIGTSGSEILGRIGRAIVAGTYPEDERLPDEASMLARYVVSRTALREAYGKLTAKGMITARQRVGTTVRPRSQWNMLDPEVLQWHLQCFEPADLCMDLFAIRRIVEPGAAALAATAADRDDLERISEAFADMQRNLSDKAALEDADLRFHLAILSATRNPFMTAFSAVIQAAMLSTFHLGWRGAEAKKGRRMAQHGEVLSAIKERDAQGASAAMAQLMSDSADDVRKGLARS